MQFREMSLNMARRLSLFFLLATLFLILILAGFGRSWSTGGSFSGSVSDGVKNVQQPTVLLLKSSMVSSSDTCDETYGFLPCSNSIVGNMFLIVVYGYFMFMAAKSLSDGCEILLEILGPGLIGGLVLPILSSLPDAIIILASGLSGSSETAQSQVSVGMGLLAGSTVMLLTVLWGSCVVVGKCDLVDSIARDSQDTKGFSLIGSGISTDIWTSYAARIMVISVVPFLIVQLPLLFNSSSQTRLAILISLVVSICLLFSYCLYQVFQPWIQRRKLAFAKHKHIMSGILKHLKMRALGKLLTEDGKPNEEVIRKLFMVLDVTKDGYLSASDLRALIIGIQFEDINLDVEDAVEKVMKAFDTSQDSRIDVTEFVNGISKWLYEAKGSADHAGHSTFKYLSVFDQETRKEHYLLGEQNDEAVEGIENPKWNTFKAVLMLLLGTILAAAFADPIVDAVDNFSTATNIPSFFVSFVVLPFACSSEVVAALIFASRKNLRSASLTFSQIYGAVIMSNVLSLSVFLGLVYFRDLTWDFSSEVLSILVVCIVMGAFASFRTTFPLWTCLLSYILYPFSLALVYVLNYVVGWS